LYFVLCVPVESIDVIGSDGDAPAREYGAYCFMHTYLDIWVSYIIRQPPNAADALQAKGERACEHVPREPDPSYPVVACCVTPY
jgi:hypothetical protein